MRGSSRSETPEMVDGVSVSQATAIPRGAAAAVPRAPATTRTAIAAALGLAPFILVLGVYAVSYVQLALALIRFPFDLDQGEGFDAWSGWLLNRGIWPYTDNQAFPYYSHEYPPVWSYLVSIPMAWLGPGLGPARAVSVLAALATAALLGVAAYRLAGRRLAFPLAAGMYLASPYVFHTTPLARVNGTATLIACVAIWLVDEPTASRVALAVAASVLAVFTKPTAADAGAAVVVFLWLARRRYAVPALVSMVIAGLAAYGGMELLSHGTYLRNIIGANSSAFELSQWEGYLSNAISIHGGIVALAVFEASYRVMRRQLNAWVVFWGCAVLMLLATVGKTGGGESYFLSTIAASSVLAASALTRLAHAARGRLLPLTLLGVACLAQAALLSHGLASELIPSLPDRGFQATFLGHTPTEADAAAAETIERVIADHPGPILSEDPSYAVAAGRQLVGAPSSSLRNLYAEGVWSADPLIADIVSHRYSVILLDAQMYPPPVLRAIGRSYYEVGVYRVVGASIHVMLPGSS